MSAIDLAILGIVLEKPQSAYEIQKDVEYHNYGKWTRISVPSVYKKVLQLREQGYMESTMQAGEKTLLKAVYSVTPKGRERFYELMQTYASQSVDFLFDFNVVIANLGKIAPERACYMVNLLQDSIKRSAHDNLETAESFPQLPLYGKTIFMQQHLLYKALLEWLECFKAELQDE